MGESKVPVSLRALVQRLNRKLAQTEDVLKKARGRSMRAEFGDYYVLNRRTNTVTQWHVDPVDLAHQVEALAAWEYVKQAE